MDLQDSTHISGPIEASKADPMRDRIKNWKAEDVNPQDDCVLFAILPREIRERIWFWAFSPVVEHDSTTDHSMNYRPDHGPDPREDQNLLAYDPSAPPSPGLPTDEDPELNGDQNSGGQHSQDFDPQNWHTYDWLRPGFPGLKYIKGVPLLRTCRRIYLEAHLILPGAADHVFWGHRPAPRRSKMPYQFFQQLPPEQLARVRAVHLYTQMFFLEGGVHDILAVAGGDLASRRQLPQPVRGQRRRGYLRGSGYLQTSGYLRSLTTLRLTVRRGDWWFNEDNADLVINPFQTRNNERLIMLANMRRALGDEKVDSWGPKYAIPAGHALTMDQYGDGVQSSLSTEHTWGAAFRFLPQLRTVIIDFETSEDKREELEHIVEWARTWRFPAAPMSQPVDAGASDYVPSTKQRSREFCVSDNYNSRDLSGFYVDPVWSWRGMMTHWSHLCTDQSCNTRLDAPLNRECGWCCRRYRMRRRALGPRLYGWTLVWVAVTVDSDL